VPRVAPHRSGLQLGKGCLKTPGKDSTRRVTFSPVARCVVTGSAVQPHPRHPLQWKAETRAERKQRLRERQVEPIEWERWSEPLVSPANLGDTRYEIDPEELDRRHREAY
jgi:hypothetical protein